MENPEKVEKLVPAKQDQAKPEILIYNSSSINQSKTLSNERVIPEASSGFNGKPLLLRIQPRRRKTDNGKLYNSNKPRRYRSASLNSWNKQPLNKNNKYDPPIIALQDKLGRIKRPMGKETEEVD